MMKFQFWAIGFYVIMVLTNVRGFMENENWLVERLFKVASKEIFGFNLKTKELVAKIDDQGRLRQSRKILKTRLNLKLFRLELYNLFARLAQSFQFAIGSTGVKCRFCGI